MEPVPGLEMIVDKHAARTPVRAALTVVACATVLGLSACGGTQEPAAADRQPTVSAPVGVKNQAARRFVEAVNAGDTDQVLASLTDDAVVVDSGRRFADRTAIRDWIDTEVTGIDGRITVNSEQATADGVVLNVEFRSSGFNGTGLRYAFVTRGDRVVRLTLG
jgi:SnoaL-like domain